MEKSGDTPRTRGRTRSDQTILMPFPPSVNTYWRHSARGIYLSKKGRDYKAEVRSLFTDSGARLMEERLELAVLLNPPDRRKRDIDNYCKSLLDALIGLAYRDDSQIDSLLVQRGEVEQGGSALVFMRPVVEWEASFWALQHCS